MQVPDDFARDLAQLHLISNRIAARLCVGGTATEVRLKVLSPATGKHLKYPLVPSPGGLTTPCLASDPGDFSPTACQEKILIALGAGSLTKKQLAAKFDNKVYLRGRGGVDELEQRGLIECYEGRYQRTELAEEMFPASEGED